MRYLLAILICTIAMAETTNSFVPYRMSPRRPAPLAATKAYGITNGITLGQVVAQLGPGWMPGEPGTGIIRWSFSDGRQLVVWSSGSTADIVLTTNRSARSRFWFTKQDEILVSPKKQSVLLEPSHAPQGKFKQMYTDAHYQFVWVERAQETTEVDVLVHNVSEDEWKRITGVSLADGKLGGPSPKGCAINMNFSKIYGGREYVPLPLRTSVDGTSGFVILPDDIQFDGGRGVYVLLFGTSWHDDAFTTRLEIRRKDLDEACKR